MLRERGQICRDVTGVPAVHTADAAGGHHVNARRRGSEYRCGHCRRPVRAPGHRPSEISGSALQYLARGAEALDLIRFQADPYPAPDHPDSRRYRASLPHDLLKRMSCRQVHRSRQPVGYHAGFQRHDRTAVSERCTDVVTDADHFHRNILAASTIARCRAPRWERC